ncbi:MAG: flagellar biosynthesis anti-sigma factor FlgM [Desulfobacterales bacterium]|nr:flagellar biosynthesis anti-sigma factor FlgM [Desulfobacterales bacterium]
MKIYGNKPPESQDINLNTQKVIGSGPKDKTTATEKVRLTDRVEFSDRSKEVAELMSAINQLPEVRTDKVRAMKEAIESGNYNIDTLKIAEKLLSEL